jgi:hypothetical protein
MSKIKKFLMARKIAALRKALVKGKMPEQGSFVSLYNNDYKVLTQPDSKICILEDNKSNKFAMPSDELVKILNGSIDVEKSVPKGLNIIKPKTMVDRVGENAKSPKPTAPKPSTGVRAADPIGTIRNGRKKVVSKKTGQTMWVNMATGESHADHQTHEPQSASSGDQKHSEDFFTSIKKDLHPSDTMKLHRQMKELLDLKQKAENALAMAHQDQRQKAAEAPQSRNQVFALQDRYRKAFKDFQTSVKQSAAKQKKERSNGS